MMNKNYITLLLTVSLLTAFCMRSYAIMQDEESQSGKSLGNDNTKIVIGNEMVIYEKSDSAFNMRIGDRGLSILETLENGRKIHFEKYDWPNNNTDKEDILSERAKRHRRFKGHWASVELGFANYLTSDNSNSMPEDIDYMTLHSGKSSCFNINFSQLSLGIGRHVGFVTGLGLNWNNFRFDGNNNITKGTNGVIEMLNPGVPLKKSKLTTLYFNIPVLFEFQIPADNHHLNIAAGPIGGVKIGSHTKMVFHDGEKVKSNEDFNLNMFHFGYTARIGYENFQIFGTYYKTSLFKDGKGPGGYDLFPYEIGLSFSFND
jgi:hypothetical protein